MNNAVITVLLLCFFYCRTAAGGVEVSVGVVKNAAVSSTAAVVLDGHGVTAYTVHGVLKQYLFSHDDRKAIQDESRIILCAESAIVVTSSGIITIHLQTEEIQRIPLHEYVPFRSLKAFSVSCSTDVDGVVKSTILSENHFFKIEQVEERWEIQFDSFVISPLLRRDLQLSSEIKAVRHSLLANEFMLTIVTDSAVIILDGDKHIKLPLFEDVLQAVASERILATCGQHNIKLYSIHLDNLILLREAAFGFGGCSDIQILHNGKILVTYPEYGVIELTKYLNIWRVLRYSIESVTGMATGDIFSLIIDVSNIKVSRTSDPFFPVQAQKVDFISSLIGSKFIYNDGLSDIFALVRTTTVTFAEVFPFFSSNEMFVTVKIKTIDVDLKNCSLTTSIAVYERGINVVTDCGEILYFDYENENVTTVSQQVLWDNITNCEGNDEILTSNSDTVGSLFSSNTVDLNYNVENLVCNRLIFNADGSKWIFFNLTDGYPNVTSGSIRRTSSFQGTTKITSAAITNSKVAFLLQQTAPDEVVNAIQVSLPGRVMFELGNGIFSIGGDVPGLIRISTTPQTNIYVFPEEPNSLEDVLDTNITNIENTNTTSTTWQGILSKGCFFVGISSSLFGASTSPGILLTHLFISHLAVKKDDSLAADLLSWETPGGDPGITIFVLLVVGSILILSATLVVVYVESGKLLPLLPLAPHPILKDFIPANNYSTKPECDLSYDGVREHLGFPSRPLLFLALFAPLLVENVIPFVSVPASLLGIAVVLIILYGLYKFGNHRREENDESASEEVVPTGNSSAFSRGCEIIRSNYLVFTVTPPLILAVFSGLLNLLGVPSFVVVACLLIGTISATGCISYSCYRSRGQVWSLVSFFRYALCFQFFDAAIALIVILSSQNDYDTSVGVSMMSLGGLLPTLGAIGEACIESELFAKKSGQKESSFEEDELEEESVEASDESHSELLRRISSCSSASLAHSYTEPEVPTISSLASYVKRLSKDKNREIITSDSSYESPEHIMELSDSCSISQIPSLSCKSYESPKRRCLTSSIPKLQIGLLSVGQVDIPEVLKTPRIQTATSTTATPVHGAVDSCGGDIADFFAASFHNTHSMNSQESSNTDSTEKFKSLLSQLRDGQDSAPPLSIMRAVSMDSTSGRSTPPPVLQRGRQNAMLKQFSPSLGMSISTSSSTNLSDINRTVSIESSNVSSNLLTASTLVKGKQNSAFLTQLTNPLCTNLSQTVPHAVSIESTSDSSNPLSPAVLAKGRQKATLLMQHTKPELGISMSGSSLTNLSSGSGIPHTLSIESSNKSNPLNSTTLEKGKQRSEILKEASKPINTFGESTGSTSSLSPSGKRQVAFLRKILTDPALSQSTCASSCTNLSGRSQLFRSESDCSNVNPDEQTQSLATQLLERSSILRAVSFESSFGSSNELNPKSLAVSKSEAAQTLQNQVNNQN